MFLLDTVKYCLYAAYARSDNYPSSPVSLHKFIGLSLVLDSLLIPLPSNPSSLPRQKVEASFHETRLYIFSSHFHSSFFWPSRHISYFFTGKRAAPIISDNRTRKNNSIACGLSKEKQDQKGNYRIWNLSRLEFLRLPEILYIIHHDRASDSQSHTPVGPDQRGVQCARTGNKRLQGRGMLISSHLLPFNIRQVIPINCENSLWALPTEASGFQTRQCVVNLNLSN